MSLANLYNPRTCVHLITSKGSQLSLTPGFLLSPNVTLLFMGVQFFVNEVMIEWVGSDLYHLMLIIQV